MTVLIVQRGFFQEKLSDYTAVNDGVAFTKEFNVKSSTAHQNSSVKGTIFVWADKGMAERMRIVASFEIDPKDFGGMTIYILRHAKLPRKLNTSAHVYMILSLQSMPLSRTVTSQLLFQNHQY